MKKQSFASMLCAAIALTIIVMPGLAAKDTAVETVGGFALKLSQSLGAPVTTEKAAVETLAAAGVKLKVDLEARLTQNEAARILADLGMKVAPPTDPNGAVSVAAASQLAATVGLSHSAGPGIATDDFPLQCLLEKNHGQCVNCCKAALGFDPNAEKAGQISKNCSRFCRTTEPPSPSDSEPLP